MIAQFARIAQIRARPAIQIVFGHAFLSKTFEFGRVAGGLRAKQAIAADFLGRTAIVDFIKFVPPAEFTGEAILQEF